MDIEKNGYLTEAVRMPPHSTNNYKPKSHVAMVIVGVIGCVAIIIIASLIGTGKFDEWAEAEKQASFGDDGVPVPEGETYPNTYPEGESKPKPESTAESEPESTAAAEPEITSAEPEITAVEPETTAAEPETTATEPETSAPAGLESTAAAESISSTTVSTPSTAAP